MQGRLAGGGVGSLSRVGDKMVVGGAGGGVLVLLAGVSLTGTRRRASGGGLSATGENSGVKEGLFGLMGEKGDLSCSECNQ